MMIKVIFVVIVLLALYQFSNKGLFNTFVNKVSAQSISAGCDAVVYTTPTCQYCKKAIAFLDREEVAWCEFDITESADNAKTHKALGGNGVPLAIIGTTKISGFSTQSYFGALYISDHSTTEQPCDVLMYTSPACTNCTDARELFDDKGVAWCEFDITESYASEREYKNLGGTGVVPLAVIGNQIWRGFGKRQYLNSLNKI